MAVTEKDLLLYDGMPWTRDAWASPCHSYPLVATRWAGGDQSLRPRPGDQLRPAAAGSCLSPGRQGDPNTLMTLGRRGHALTPLHLFPRSRLVHSGSGRRSPALGSELTFATRTGSRQGVEMHVFRVETHRDLSSWTRVLVQGCHAAAELVKEVTVGECCGAGDPGLPAGRGGLGGSGGSG